MVCAGHHRGLGSHVSKVRSVRLDDWSLSQVEHMRKRGNAAAAAWFESRLPPDFVRPVAEDAGPFIARKYVDKDVRMQPMFGDGRCLEMGGFICSLLSVLMPPSPVPLCTVQYIPVRAGAQ